MAGPSDGMNGNGNLPLHHNKALCSLGGPLLALHSCVPPDFFSCPVFVVAWASSIHAVLLMTNGSMHRTAGPSDGMNGNGNLPLHLQKPCAFLAGPSLPFIPASHLISFPALSLLLHGHLQFTLFCL